MFPIFLFVASALGAEMSPLKRQILKFQPERVEFYKDVARALLPKRFWAAQPSSYKPLVGAAVKPVCGCSVEDMFQLHDVFFSNITGPVDVDFYPNADSQPLEGEIWFESSTATIDTSTFKWEQNGEVSFEWSFQVAGAGPKAGLKLGYKVGQDSTETKTTTFTKKRKLSCPQGHLCQVQTWSFSASIPGNYFKVPVVDFKCLPACLRWKHEETGLYHELNSTSKVALAALAGKSSTWDSLGKEYFELRDKDNNPVSSCPPGGETIVGIQFPPESVKTIYTQAKPHNPSVPILDETKKPYQIQIMLDFYMKNSPGEKKREAVVASLTQEDLDAMKPEDVEVKFFVIDSNIPGVHADKNIGN
ncbi:hypothetical protein MAC_06601 [Metarhizium acridum CQMa 102]|uniref:Uncharacterized protein n=1 Tax=Metarhizium acridum (strain CQMa 102) TaxID=655827 RepID=E9E9Q3_METAQ|nr:uncharacterized protein MAC_06601 [Metarhizium acridum CQMa 102]EFY87366.1 hypothetical protein MAC_06601 [Metarhizium acridum CQMa 102]